jgi:peptide/nickel transport system permease protein
LRGVSRRSSAPGRCSTTVRSRPTSLPTPWSRFTMRRRYRNNGGLLAFFVRRFFFAAVVLVAVAIIDYGLYRALDPHSYPGQSLVGGTAHDLGRLFLHFDLGRACEFPGCPPVRAVWGRYWAADVYLLIGGLVIGVVAGVSAAVWCASRPRSFSTRAIEAAGTFFYSIPVYLVGLGVLLLFEPTFGAFPLPFFFHPLDYEAPLENPWNFVRAMIVPWLVVAAPLAAVCLRLTQASILEVLDTDYVRTGAAKGLSRRRLIRRHAAPAGYVTLASLIGVWVPTFVTNMVLVEFVFFVPGFFAHTKRALGQIKELPPVYDIPMLQALALWAAVLIVVVSAIADCVIIVLDPRVRDANPARPRPVG